MPSDSQIAGVSLPDVGDPGPAWASTLRADIQYLIGRLFDVFDVESYRPSAGTDEQAANAAYAALAASTRGGILRFAAKAWNLGQWHVAPVFDTSRQVIIEGQGDATKLQFTERGTPTPRCSTTTTGGSLASGNYAYRLSVITSAGEIMAGFRASVVVPAGTSTNTVVLTWSLPSPQTCRGNAVTGVKIYGRTSGSEQLMATLGVVTTWTDTGSVSPSGALPAGNTIGCYVIEPPVGQVGSNVFVRDLLAVGPSGGSAVTPGVAPAHMGFYRMLGRARMENVKLRGFYIGGDYCADHVTSRLVDVSSCYYGMGSIGTQATSGDNTIDECDLTENAMASMGIGTTQQFSGVLRGGHLGVGPYGVYLEAGPVNPSNTLDLVIFDKTSWEELGLGAIYDESNNKLVNELTIRHPGNGFKVNQSSSFLFGSRTYDQAHIKAYQLTNLHLDDTPALDTTPPVVIDAVYLAGMRWTGTHDVQSTLAKLANFDLNFDLLAAEVTGRGTVRRAGLYRPYPSAIVAGQLVELTSTGDVQPHATGMILGVALNSAAAYNGTTARRGCLVVSEGSGIPVLAQAGGIGMGDLLVPDATNPTKVNKSTGAGKPVIGRLHYTSGDGTSGTVIAHVCLGGVT